MVRLADLSPRKVSYYTRGYRVVSKAEWGVNMGWVKVRDHWLNLGTVVFCRNLSGDALVPMQVQVAVNAPDPLGSHEQNDHTGLLSFVYSGDDAAKIWRRFRV